ncbi:MAG TPA: type II toxin-antitoxin system RelE/ParE family toxin [Candidatus Eremiobacteraceae bacterium]|nr:type II toxin-antitoxin system RelE/ParE family toxin [Candidatus Eremiobacteraceae bacterium]
MKYRVELTKRAWTDLRAIYDFIEAESSSKAFQWFNRLSEAIYSLEDFPERGSRAPELRELRQLLFGAKPDGYRVIYMVDKKKRIVMVLHIRHAARRALPVHWFGLRSSGKG